MKYRVFDREVHRASENSKKRRINIVCVHETKLVGAKAQDVDSFKLWHSSGLRDRNGVGILVNRDIRDYVVEVRIS